jgi:hypothetical protein
MTCLRQLMFSTTYIMNSYRLYNQSSNLNGWSSISIVIDRFTKIDYFIAVNDNAEKAKNLVPVIVMAI